MSTKTEGSEKESQTTEVELKISLQVAQIGDNIAMETAFNGASSELLAQSIFYMLDQAYGSREAVETLIKVMPEMSEQWYKLKEATDAVVEQQALVDELKEGLDGGQEENADSV